MSAFTGAQGKGAMRIHRESKRAAAEVRAQGVDHERTRRHRLGKCACDSPEARLLNAVFGGAA